MERVGTVVVSAVYIVIGVVGVDFNGVDEMAFEGKGKDVLADGEYGRACGV